MKNSRLQHEASLHEKAVQKIAKDQFKSPVRKRKAPTKKPQVNCIKPDPRVLKKALQLAKGDMNRLQLMDDCSIIVHNHPRKEGYGR